MGRLIGRPSELPVGGTSLRWPVRPTGSTRSRWIPRAFVGRSSSEKDVDNVRRAGNDPSRRWPTRGDSWRIPDPVVSVWRVAWNPIVSRPRT